MPNKVTENSCFLCKVREEHGGGVLAASLASMMVRSASADGVWWHCGASGWRAAARVRPPPPGQDAALQEGTPRRQQRRTARF